MAIHRVKARTFVWHYLQMLVAMGIGMVVLGPQAMRVVHHPGVEGEMLLMATTMVAGMAVWMVCRGDAWTGILTTSAAMYVSVAVVFPFFWLGAVTASGLMVLGHVAMLLGMALAMLHTQREDPVEAP